jgi:hypothetical protein
VHVEVVETGSGTGWVPGRLVELAERWEPLAVVVDPRSPAGALLPLLESRVAGLVKVSAQELGQACGGFFQSLSEDGVRHIGQPELDDAVDGAATRPLGDAWAWSRRVSRVDITPLVAVTLARWGFASAEAGLVDVTGSVW